MGSQERRTRGGMLHRLPLGRLYARVPAWVRIVLAAASLVLGVIIVIRPTTAIDVLAILLGIGMMLTGVLELTGRADDSERTPWRAVTSTAWFAGGAFVLLWPSLTVSVVAFVVGALLLFNGALGIASVFRRGREWDERLSDAAFGATGIIFGVLALAWPDITLLVAGVAFGARLVMGGVIDLWNAIRRRRAHLPAGGPAPPRRRFGRTALAVASVALAVTTVVVTVPLREGSPVVDGFYAAPRDTPGDPGELVRAERFERGMPDDAVAWRILYTTTGVSGEIRVASGLVVVPAEGDGPWPVVDWNHGTTGFARDCAPSLQPRPLWSGALYVLPRVIDQGWAVVATDYIGLGTQGPHPYLVGRASATASLDAVRAARQLEDAHLAVSTVVWGHSQGGAAALWTGAIARQYAPEVWVRGVAALAPASNPGALVDRVSDIVGGEIFASFAFAAFADIYDDVRYEDYIRPGAEPIIRAMSERCLADPDTAVSVLAVLGMSGDRMIFSTDPRTGPLGAHLRENIPPPTITAPVLIAQGTADSVVLASSQDAYVARLCREGQPVDYRTYAGREHGSLVERPSPLLPELFEWTRARFAGEPVALECRRTDH